MIFNPAIVFYIIFIMDLKMQELRLNKCPSYFWLKMPQKRSELEGKSPRS